MKRKIFRIIFILIALILISVIVVRVYLYKVMDRSLPDYNENVILKNLNNDVTVYRDQYAIPHIYATNETDLYRTTGYIMAQDRMWQMDLLRRVTQGRLAEIFPKEMLEVDILFRSLRINEKSIQLLDSTDKQIIVCLEAFADGINQYIEQNSDNLPVEFKILGYKPDKWEPVHSINLIGYMAWSLKAGWTTLFLEEMREKLGDEKTMELIPNVTLQKEFVFPASSISQNKNNYTALLEVFKTLKKYNLEGLSASNNWAVNGSKSQSGKPLFANDMHLDYNLPGIWFQIHQVVEGQLNVTGVALPGQPLIIVGHNEKIAWGMTNTYVDNLDFYMEKINPNNKDQYEVNGEWKDLIVKKEIFKNKKGEETKKIIRYSHRGPIISDFKNIGKTLSMQWIGSYYSNELEAVYKLNRAQNWEDFKNAVKGFITISQNINYADVSGNIGIYCCAGLPIRNRDILFSFLPGWTDQYDWKGLVSFEELPFQYNPSCNYISSANNRTVDDTYPHYIGAWHALQYRIERIREVLESRNNFAPDDFMQLQTDNISKLAPYYVPRILEFLEERKTELTKQEFIDLENFKIWDYSYHLNSNVSLLFEQTYTQILANLVKDEMGEELFSTYLSGTTLPKYTMENAFKQKYFSWCDDITTSEIEENLADIVVRSFKDAVEIISKQQGGKMANWKWSKKHTLTLEHPLGKVEIVDRLLNLNRGPYPLDGTWHTIAQYSYEYSEPFKVIHGASQRHIYDLSNWDNSVSVMPTGNCGIATSPHYIDQTELYVNNKYHEDLFSKKRIIENAKYVTRVIKAE